MHVFSKLARVVLVTPIALAFVLTQTGCPDDPHDASTWTGKLGNKHELERALTELQRLKEPSSIKPLADAWESHNHPARILRIIISVADQYDPGTDAEPGKFGHLPDATTRRLSPTDKNFEAQREVTDPDERKKIAEIRYKAAVKRTYGPHHKKGPYWDQAIPILKKSVELYLDDDNNDRLIENAIAAVNALGKAKEFGTDSDVQTIIDAAKHSVPSDSKAQVVRITALRALGKWSESDAAKTTLISVLELAGEEDQHPAVFASAADALGYAKSVDAVDPLIKAMFNLPAVYGFCRRSLVAIGAPAIPRLLAVFEGKHKQMNKFAKEKKFFAKCEGFKTIIGANGKKQRIKASLGGSKTCISPKGLQVKSANLLGDLLAKQALPAMLKELDEKPQPSGWHPQSGAPFPNQHQAIFIALRKMGANKNVADRLLAYAKDKNSEDGLAAFAIATYSYVTRDTSQLAYLSAVMTQATDRLGNKLSASDKDPAAPTAMAASLAYSRLANTRAHMVPFKSAIKRHKKAAKSYEKKFEKANKAFEKLEPAWKKASENYKTKIVRPTIKAWNTANAALKKSDPAKYKKLRDDKPWFATIKKKHKAAHKKHGAGKLAFEKAEREKLGFENKMNQATALQRTAEQNMARIVVGVQCKGDPKCLVSFGTKKPDDVAKVLEKDIPGASKWQADQKRVLWVAAGERALLELGKLGKKASSVEGDLLALLPVTERFIREGVLLALPQVATLPCAKCVSALDGVIKEQKDQTPLAALTADARVWRNFYSWAGTKQ